MSRGREDHTHAHTAKTTQGPELRGLHMQACAPSAGFPSGPKHTAGQGGAACSAEEQQAGTKQGSVSSGEP